MALYIGKRGLYLLEMLYTFRGIIVYDVKVHAEAHSEDNGGSNYAQQGQNEYYPRSFAQPASFGLLYQPACIPCMAYWTTLGSDQAYRFARSSCQLRDILPDNLLLFDRLRLRNSMAG